MIIMGMDGKNVCLLYGPYIKTSTPQQQLRKGRLEMDNNNNNDNLILAVVYLIFQIISLMHFKTIVQRQI